MSDYKLQTSRFYKNVTFSGTGIIDPADGHNLYGEQSTRIKIIGVGASNEVLVQGKMRGTSIFTTLATIEGEGEILLDISTIDTIRFEVNVYDQSGIHGQLLASGYFSTGPVNAVNQAATVVQTREETRVNVFGEITALTTGATGTVLTYTPPAGKTFVMDYVEMGGTNAAVYAVYVGGDKQAVKRTNSLNLGESVNFEALSVDGGSQIKVEVTHDRPDAGNFESRLVGILRS